MRERLLERVQARLERFEADKESAEVLAPEAVAEVAALLETVADPAADLEVAHAAGWLHWVRYLVLDPGDDEQDLETALALFAPVYRAFPEEVPDQVRAYFDEDTPPHDPEALANRAFTLLQETLRTGDDGVLDTAIDLFRQAGAATPDDHPDRAAILSQLRFGLDIRFERTGDPADLDAVIGAGRDAVAATSDDDPDRPSMLSDLGLSLGLRFERTGDLADLDDAVGAYRQAVAAAPDDHSDRATYLDHLGLILRMRFDHVRDAAALEEAVGAYRQAVAATPDDHPERAERLSTLGNTLRIRFTRRGTQLTWLTWRRRSTPTAKR